MRAPSDEKIDRGEKPLSTAATRWILGAMLLAGAIAVVLVHRDYGITWDETIQSRYGEQALAYFAIGFGAAMELNDTEMRFTGPLVEMIPALFYGESGVARYEIRHLIGGLLALLAIPAIMLYGRLLGRRIIPIAAVAALFMMPRFVGQAFNNSKDIPFAVGIAWFMWAATSMFARSDFRPRRALACALAMGLTAAVRPGGVPIMAGLLGAIALLWCGSVWRPGSRGDRPVGAADPIGAAAVVVIVAWIVMVAPWPWAHENIIVHPVEAITAAARFPVAIEMRFEGRMINSDALPWHYLLKYILITTPPTLLLLAAGGAFIALREFRRDRRSTRSFVGAVTLLWLLLPIGAFIVLRPCAYDGMRHFLFLLPALAVLAAIGVAGALAAARGRARWIAWPVVVALLLIPAKDVVGLHPYQSTFFNVFVGGLAGAEGRYETDYWVSSYREAMTWVNQRAAADSEHVFTVLVGGAPTLGEAASWYAAANVRARFVGRADLGRTLPAEVEYYLSTTRFGCDDLYPDAPIVHEIGRRGAVFCVIKAH